MILVTGASGKTGKTIVHKLSKLGLPTRAIVRTETQVDGLIRLGAAEVVIAELRDAHAVNSFFQGIEKVYHICPNMSPDEEIIGELMISAARENDCSQFVYHSVLHPQVEVMPHHWHKMRVEEKLLQSNIPIYHSSTSRLYAKYTWILGKNDAGWCLRDSIFHSSAFQHD